jgi:hypothetical protein
MFGQALAVIGLAGAGANDRIAIDKLASQQCSEGYFRIFFGYIPTDETGDHVTENGQKVSTCDEGKAHGQSAPDGDATGLALSALLAARKAGATGLDGPIDRTVDWLKGHQKPGGGWGGGVSTEAPNTNSTGLIVQSLAEAGGATAAVDKGAAYLASAQATKERDAGNALSAQIGAIGYTPGDYEAARTGGITGIDTWIRAGAQASLGLAQTGFFDLVRGKTPPEGEDPPTDGSGGDPDDPDDHAGPDDSDDPSDTKDPKGRAPNKKRPGSTGSPSHHRTPPNSDRDPDTGRPAPPPDSPRGAARTVVQPRDKRAEPAPDTPAGRLGRYLANRLTDGDHIEITQDGKKYVDYDATADLVLALRVLDEQPKAVAGATGFLLASDSVQAYAYGAPYESGPAAYAEPLAKLRLLAGFRTAARTAARPTAADSTPQAATASRLTADLAALRTPDGRFTDKGEHGEATGSTRRHAWATIATLADPSPAAAPAAKAALRTLIKQQCKDGTFPKTLRPEADGCRTGDLAATAAATEALNAQPAAGTSAAASDPRPAEAASAVPKGWAPGRFRALSASAAALNRNADADGLIRSTGTTPDTVLSALTAAGRQAAGLDATTTARALGPLLRPDGGMAEPRGTRSDPVTSIAVAPGVAGGSWISAPGSPVSRAVTLTADALDRDPATASGNRDGGLPTWAVATLAAAGCVLVLAAFPAVRRFVRKNVRRSGGTKAVTT